MKYLIFGDTGFLGSHLANKLTQDGHDVFGISKSPKATIYPRLTLDLVTETRDSLKHFIKSIAPNVILHYASYPIVKNYGPDCTNDILITHKILDCCPDDCKFIYASSTAVYSRHSQFKNVGGATNPVSVYGLNKLHCENLIELYASEYNTKLKYVILRYCAHANIHTGIVGDLIKKLKGPDTNLEIFGKNPGSKKPYLEINNSVERTLELINLNNKMILNVSAEDNITVREIADILMQELGIFKKIKWLGKDANWRGDHNFMKVWPSDKYVWPNQIGLGYFENPLVISSRDAIIKCIRDNKKEIEAI